MTEEFLGYLERAQAMQRRFSYEFNSFSVTIKYDDYYEDYIEVELRTDDDRFFFSTYSCVTEEEYETRLGELLRTVNEILNPKEEKDE